MVLLQVPMAHPRDSVRVCPRLWMLDNQQVRRCREQGDRRRLEGTVHPFFVPTRTLSDVLSNKDTHPDVRTRRHAQHGTSLTSCMHTHIQVLNSVVSYANFLLQQRVYLLFLNCIAVVSCSMVCFSSTDSFCLGLSDLSLFLPLFGVGERARSSFHEYCNRRTNGNLHTGDLCLLQLRYRLRPPHTSSCRWLYFVFVRGS